tara:strand:+ start:755 stop:979 length:225 start_codon:yes stop_codon:yes gene_type:complete
MSLEYTKRLLELRDYATKELTGQSTKEDSITSLVSKPMEDDVEEINPLEKIQKSAFLEVVMSNLQIKEEINDSV